MHWLRVALIPLVALALAPAGFAEQHEGGMPHHPPMGMAESGDQGMVEKMQARQQKLDDLVAAMEAAKGEAKVDAIADVVKELVAQRRAMNERMQEMHGQMMESMHPGEGPQHGERPGSATGGHEH